MAERVLVTGAGGTGVGASVLAALQQDPDAVTRWKTVAVDAEPFSAGLYTADDAALVPWADDPFYVDAVAEVAARHGVAAIIPGTEAETVVLAGRRDDLPVPVVANDSKLMPLMRDKTLAQAKLGSLGLPVVASYPWEHRAEAAVRFGFPLVVKPTRETSGSRGVHLVHSLRELSALDGFAAATPGVVVQPYLGTADDEYTVGVLSGRDGEVAGSIVMRRKLTGLSLLTASGGAAVSTGFSQGHIVDAPAIATFCEGLAKRLGSVGPLNLQLRMHGGVPHVFEIHPRFSFSTSIRAAAGFNEPDLLLRHFVHGEPLKRPAHRTGVVAMRFFDQVLVPEDRML